MATNLGTNDDTCAIMKENIMLKEKLNKVSSKFFEFSGKLESLISEYKEFSEEQLLVDEKGQDERTGIELTDAKRKHSDDGGNIDQDGKKGRFKDTTSEGLFDSYQYQDDENQSEAGSISEERVNIEDDVDFIKTEESTDESYPCDESKYLAKATTDLKMHTKIKTRNKCIAQEINDANETIDKVITEIQETTDQDTIDEDLKDIDDQDMEDLSSEAIDQILLAEVKQEMTVLETSQYQKVAGGGYLCNECPVTHRYVVDIKRHVKIHGGATSKRGWVPTLDKLPCPKCDFTGSESNLRHHIRQEHETHKMNDLKINDLKCTQCDFVTKVSSYLSRKKALLRHMERVHGSGDKIICAECDFQTNTKEYLSAHVARKHKIAEKPCDECEYVAKNANDLKNHKKSHRLYQCDKCSYSTIHQVGFKSHLEQHLAAEEGIKYSCTECDHIANSKHLLVCHVYRAHNRTFSFCDQCDFKTKRKDRFRDHMNKHIGLVLNCEHEQCTFSASSKLSMKQHDKQVHNKTVIRCDQCDYSTHTTFYLKNHKKMHHSYMPDSSTTR